MAPALQTALQNRLNELLESEDLNGVSCYLESAEHGYWYGAAGIENIAQNRPMDTTYSFWAASVNKIFTSALIFMLYEDSLLDIEDKIVDYVPGHSNINPNATIEQALNHSSGIAEILRHPSAAQQWYNHNANKVWDPNEVLSNYLQAQDFAPGSAWSYSNTNYILLGMIIEKVSGKSYAEFLEEKIILPLSLSNTWFPPFMESEQAISKGYSDFNQDGEWDDANFLHTPSFASMVFAAGALVSTPKDLTKMAQALYNGNLFSNPETLEHYLQFLPVRISQHALGYGYGCNSFDYLGDTYYG
ncbi:MAG: serine hydrolase domain-containing protein, partial [Luteibaculum sp.]